MGKMKKGRSADGWALRPFFVRDFWGAVAGSLGPDPETFRLFPRVADKGRALRGVGTS